MVNKPIKKIKAVVNAKGMSKGEAVTLAYLAEGYTRPEIAKKINKSLSMVNRYVENLAVMFDAHSHAEIVSTAIALGVVRLELRDERWLSHIVLSLFFVMATSLADLHAIRISNAPLNRTSHRTINRSYQPYGGYGNAKI